MSRLKDIEHDGFEEFNDKAKFNRKKSNKILAALEKVGKDNLEKEKAEAQEKYMSFNNPLLWEGDVDYD